MNPTALWALGFRPFYLLAAVQAALVLPLWVLVFGGQTGLASPLPGSLWHAGEMVSGFAMAVIVGFLFTAGRNWSGQPTPSGGALAPRCGCWPCTTPRWRARPCSSHSTWCSSSWR